MFFVCLFFFFLQFFFYINLFKELLLVFVQSVRGVFRMYLVCQEWSWYIHGALVCQEWSWCVVDASNMLGVSEAFLCVGSSFLWFMSRVSVMCPESP